MSSKPRGGGYAARAGAHQKPSRGGGVQDANYRSNQLDKLFYNTIEGRSVVTNPSEAQRFLESIVNRTDKPDCIERLASSKAGQTALHKSLTFSNSPRSINTSVASLLTFLGDPALKRVCNGELLNQILWVMADPPVFWNSIVQNVRNKLLENEAMEGFMWLLLQLVILPPSQSATFRETAQSLLGDNSIATESSPTVEGFLQKIKVLLKPSSAKISPDLINLGPGGRHDNDFVNYHDISILPTCGELQSTESPFYLQASTIFGAEKETRAFDHLDNQFRLLREDMLAEMREELANAKNGRKRQGWRNMIIKNLALEDLDTEAMQMERPCSMILRCDHDILKMKDHSIDDRKRELKNTPTFLRHQSFGCIMKDNTVLAFAVLNRNENKLALLPPQMCLLVVSGPESLKQVFLALYGGTVDYLLLSTPIFAYEPILERLQRKTDIELDHDILSLSESPMLSTIRPRATISALENSMAGQSSLQTVLGTSKPINLDPSQTRALIHGLQYQTSQIQGPPGTGKSLVGALLAKALLDNTAETILVLSYTNHALDQFLEELEDIGIDRGMMVRLGSKSTARTASLLLSAQNINTSHRKKTRYDLINSKKDALRYIKDGIEACFDEYKQNSISNIQILHYLEFTETGKHFYDALSVPEAEEGETLVGRKGAPMSPDYLFTRWAKGENAGAFAEEKSDALCDDVWQMPKADRQGKIQEWTQNIHQEKLTMLVKKITEFNKVQKEIQSLQKEKMEQILQSKRIIGCTTTAASMFASEIQAASPGVIIVEEAGEILESHILAAMGPTTKQLIQIGDHKQLRPKIKNFKLTVEANRGYDLNRSLFERLLIQGRPHCTLLNQHRMRPEISRLIRHNYPNLEDAKSTANRPHLLGFQHDLVFFDHKHPEERDKVLVDKLDQGGGSSKQNSFEARMILKCIRYLGQQNYKTTDLVVLTPYLGQLSLLRKMLSNDLDPILNDLDSHDLVSAGVMPAASANVNKRPIRLSTIDNYQGEESDIVLVSLTRSNDDGDIGFMSAPERLNVLVSRARNALIMIGNASTFLNAKKGREEWTRFFDNLKTGGKIQDGFPLKCEKHPDRTAIVRRTEDFDIHSPDGGCSLPCSEMLSCGKHTCSMRCHIRIDHSSMPCNAVLDDFCPQNHKLVWQCSQKQPPACQACRHEKDEQIRKARRNKDLELERQAKQLAYAKQLKAIQDMIASQRESIKQKQEEQTRQQTLQRYQEELSQVIKEAQKQSTATVPSTSSKKSKSKPDQHVAAPTKDEQSQDCKTSPPQAGTHKQDAEQTPKSDPEPQDGDDEPEAPSTNAEVPLATRTSSAEEDWQHQKEYEQASNKALDTLMGMIGLESVKMEFLNIKARVDTAVRQGTDLKDERFGAALLGNPGTGKTTVARLYAKFLSSVGAIPGDHFEETTGSKLAHDGVQGCKALIDQILQKGGGVFFLDEAYQIVSGASFGGAQVLDFLLAEIENLTGKVVFVFAGYRKQMETFFGHNPGIPSRIPIRLDFQDYEDDELLRILNHQMDKKFHGRMKVEGGAGGLYARIVARRIGRGRGREGFGNAREVQNVFQGLLKRQADRLHRERRQGHTPDDLLLRKIDLVGPEPSKAISTNKDWQKLQEMIGLESVKQSVQVLIDRLQMNYERELKEKPLVECSLNKVFVGNPGTGKTTVGKLYGKILVALGLLSNGEVVIKNPSDFVGAHLGQSEKNTKAILDATKGKVLIIDEAYMLAGGSSDSGGVSDPYKTAVVDTIVAEVQSTALEDRCVLLLGYKEQMEDMFQKVNPGLTRRFPISSGFMFEDFDDEQLRKILELKLKQQGFRAGEAAKEVVLDVLRRARNRPNFGNAGEVDIILDQAKERQQKRLSEFPNNKNVDLLDPRDIDPEFDRGEHAATNIRILFKDVIGCEEIVEQLEGYQQVVQNMKAMGSSDVEIRSQIPFSFLFRGPPGTGKTSTARRMGKIYYDMSFLSEASVVECSATDLIGQYVGHTGPKVQKKFKEALGRVLFIDEAYRLAEGHFAKEAMDEIVDCLTKEQYQHKLVVILAGYDDDINRLMNQNPGLTSRFPETISFYNLPPPHCRDLLLQCLVRKKLDTSDLEASPTLDGELLGFFSTLSRTPSWGNARDVQTLAKSVFSRIMKSKTPSPSRMVPEALVLDVTNAMITERTSRAASTNDRNHNQPRSPRNIPAPPIQQQQQQPEPPRVQTSTSTTTEPTPEKPAPEKTAPEKTAEEPPEEPAPHKPSPGGATRDAGVSDAVWEQLQRDKLAAAQRQRELAEARREAEELERRVREQEALLRQQADDAARREELRRLEAARDAAARARAEREERARREQAVKERLARSGRCPVGFDWIMQGDGGYRCAGGSHYVSAGQLGL